MARTKKRKAATVAGVSVLTAALLLGGTFAWQSISQMALNENKASVNPGARLHDDYSGNYAKSTAKAVSDVGVKRVYVENFTNEQDKVSVIARVRLDEYMEIGGSAGYKTVKTTENGNNVAPYTNGVVTVSETKENNGDVKITLTALPYTGYKVDTVTADGTDFSGSNGVYTHTYTPGSNPVNIAVTFAPDSANDYTGDTIDPAVSLETNAKIDDVKTWKIYIPALDSDGKTLKENTASAFRDYVTLNFGWDSKYDTKGIYYMPTFNKNKDSLTADINGTYAAGFNDYEEYTSGQTVQKNAVYDEDSNTVDEGENAVKGLNYTEQSETHTASAIDKTKSKVISMAQWKDDYKMAPGDYWVYDTDGWAYWANLLEPETATGLFLSRNEMTGTPEDNWYYGMNVVGQFVTSEDIGSDSNKVGFYADDADAKPSDDAKILLGVLKSLINPLSLTSGDKKEITSMKNGVVPAVLTTSDNDGTWTVTDEEVVAVTIDESGKVWAQAKKPGDAVIVYTSSANEVTAVRVKVASKLYEITPELVANPETDEEGIFEKVVTYSDENVVSILGTYVDEVTNTHYQIEIGEKAFLANTTITGLNLGEGITYIGIGAFSGCTNLKGELKFPSTMLRVETQAFVSCAFNKITLNEGLERIGAHAFDGILGCSNFTIPASVTDVGIGAWMGAGFSELKVAEGSTSFYAENRVLYTYDRTKIVAVLSNVPADNNIFTISEGIKEIEAYAFRRNYNLKTIIIPEGVESIGNMAFAQMNALMTIKIPASVTNIGAAAFSATPNLKEIQIDSANTSYRVQDGILYDYDMKTLISCPSGYSGDENGLISIPDSVTTITHYAFWANKGLNALKIPKSVISVDPDALMSNSSLLKIYYEGTEAEWQASALSQHEVLGTLQIICSDTVQNSIE